MQCRDLLLPENVSGYTYQQLFENADWALYQAKKNGKNRYAFCDNLRHFEDKTEKKQELYEGVEIDARYLHNDIVSTAFEIFEKMSSFQTAIELLMKVIGLNSDLTGSQSCVLKWQSRKQTGFFNGFRKRTTDF